MSATGTALEEDLDALFDTMSATRQKEIAATHAASTRPDEASAKANPDSVKAVASVEAIAGSDGMYNRIGTLTRQLHEALRELGFDKALASAASEIPDARDRLGYIAKLTGQAADRALAAVEIGQTELKALEGQASTLSSHWDQFFSGAMGIEDFRSLARESRNFMVETRNRTEAAQHQLTEIMMAQDFHDLTGQVINRLSSLVQKMENEMVRVLVDTLPTDRRIAVTAIALEGPQVNSSGRVDIVTDQGQVDELLESLGF